MGNLARVNAWAACNNAKGLLATTRQRSPVTAVGGRNNMENPRSIGGWATAVLALLYVGLAGHFLELGLSILRISGSLSPNFITMLDAPSVVDISLFEGFQGVMALVELVTYFVFGRWIWIASRNLWDRELDGLNFTPAACIWWHAVPLANWVIPFRAMSEIWNGSHRADFHDMQQAPRTVSIWWAFWVVNGLFGYFLALSAAKPESPAFLFSAAFGCGLYWFASRLITRITYAQRSRMHNLSEVFA
jgi:hypothetical protein